jgi:RNA polymerase sigma-70 factor (ECF subfamily)
LKTLTRAAWHTYVTRQKRHGGSRDAHMLDLLNQDKAQDDLTKQLEEQYEAELLDEASVRVRLRVEPQTWEAFRLLVYEELSGAEIAGRLEMKVGAVYVAKSRVQKMLQEEIERLDNKANV